MIEPFDGRCSLFVFDDRVVIHPMAKTRSTVPMVVVPNYALQEVGRISVISARDLAVIPRIPPNPKDALAINERLWGTTDNMKIQRDHKLLVLHFRDSVDASQVDLHRYYVIDVDTEAVTREFSWDGLTESTLTDSILALMSEDFESLEEERQGKLGGDS